MKTRLAYLLLALLLATPGLTKPSQSPAGAMDPVTASQEVYNDLWLTTTPAPGHQGNYSFETTFDLTGFAKNKG